MCVPFSSTEQGAFYKALNDRNVPVIRETLQEVEWTAQAAQDLETSILSSVLYGFCAINTVS